MTDKRLAEIEKWFASEDAFDDLLEPALIIEELIQEVKRLRNESKGSSTTYGLLVGPAPVV